MVIGTLVVMSMSSFTVFASEDSNDYGYELDLTCSSTKYFDDEDTTTYFYVETDYEGESITLVNADDLTEYTMLDDGNFSISGDNMPYDAVYSLRLELNTDGVTYEKIQRFYRFMRLRKTALYQIRLLLRLSKESQHFKSQKWLLSTK